MDPSKKTGENNTGKNYSVYKLRWGVLLTATITQLANQVLWISYSSVATAASEYFDKTISEVDLLATISMIVGVPMCLITTYLMDTFGFKCAMYVAAIFTFLGGVVRCLSTLPGLNDLLSLDLQFTLSVVGQALTGMGNPIIVSIPTKISQNWFPENERTLATGILSMSMPIGICCGQGLSPLFVKHGSDVPLMNIVWVVPAVLTMVMCVIFIRSSNPPTPPSPSAELAFQKERTSFREYLRNMKKVFTNKAFLIIFIIMGGAVGFFNAFVTQLSQLMCSRGYGAEFSGLCGSLMLGTGFVGAIATGIWAEKSGKLEEIAKGFYCIAGICGILICEFIRKPNQLPAIAIFCSLFGIFGFGAYPTVLELSVEATYPVDESIGTAMIFLSGQVQGFILILVSEVLEQPLVGSALDLEVCSIEDSATNTTTITSTTPMMTSTTMSSTSPGPSEGVTAKDHTNFLLVIAGYITALVLIFVIFFRTKYKRKNADLNMEKSNNDFVETTRF